MHRRQIMSVVWAGVLAACGSGSTTFVPDEPVLADSVDVSLTFIDEWSGEQVALASIQAFSGGRELRRTSFSHVLFPGRGGVLEIRMPVDDGQSGAIYGPASVTVEIPDTVTLQSPYGLRVGYYAARVPVTPLKLGVVKHELLYSPPAPEWILSLRHTEDLATLALDSIAYFVGGGCGMISPVPCPIYVNVHAAQPTWMPSWSQSATEGSARIALPAPDWPLQGDTPLILRAFLHDQTRTYQFECYGNVPTIRMGSCNEYAWLRE